MERVTQDSLETRTYLVPAMSCGHCVSSITAEVTKVSGVRGVTIDLDTKLVTVNGTALDDNTIRVAIDDAGFDVATS